MPRIGLAMRIPTIEDWIRSCENGHDDCAANLSLCALPARILDVGTDPPRLRHPDTAWAIETDFGGRLQYCALSHCWGESGVPLRTTHATIASFEESIPFVTLPRTFQDAVTVARALGLRYLWIDSLCILQDDGEDWNREAAKMADIFHGAYLTISASSANNCHAGCLGELLPHPAVQFDLPSGAKIFLHADFLREAYHSVTLEGFPIHKRGWIFQEIFLSRRVVHITNEQIYWQCRCLLESEDQILSRISEVDLVRLEDASDAVKGRGLRSTQRLTNVPLSGFQSLRQSPSGLNWWMLMRDHSSRALTFPKDSLPSLAGTVALWQRLAGDEPVLGMWKKELPVHLSWLTRSQWEVQSQDLTMPSWTWFAIQPQSRKRSTSWGEAFLSLTTCTRTNGDLSRFCGWPTRSRLMYSGPTSP